MGPRFDRHAVIEYFRTHTREATAQHFGCSQATVTYIARTMRFTKRQPSSRVLPPPRDAYDQIAREFRTTRAVVRAVALSVLATDPDLLRGLVRDDMENSNAKT